MRTRGRSASRNRSDREDRAWRRGRGCPFLTASSTTNALRPWLGGLCLSHARLRCVRGADAGRREREVAGHRRGRRLSSRPPLRPRPEREDGPPPLCSCPELSPSALLRPRGPRPVLLTAVTGTRDRRQADYSETHFLRHFLSVFLRVWEAGARAPWASPR